MIFKNEGAKVQNNLECTMFNYPLIFFAKNKRAAIHA